MRILVTNDDGIDSVGLHVLARAMQPFGEVVVAAPDQEYSGAGAAIGALHLIQPEVHKRRIDGIDTAWAVSGPPALCVFFARLGLYEILLILWCRELTLVQMWDELCTTPAQWGLQSLRVTAE
jgi:5'/3'-nucleotidase SurE